MSKNNNKKGSIMSKNSVTTLNFARQEIPENIQKITPFSEKKWVSWGNDNLYPFFLYGLYESSPLLSSILHTYRDYIIGDGFEGEKKEVNRKGLTKREFVEGLILDYLIYGCCCFQRIGEELYNIDMKKVRINSEEDIAWYSDWEKSGKKIKYPINNDFESVSFYYYKTANSTETYSKPIYQSAIKAIVTDAAIYDFHMNNVINCFSPSTLISFNSGLPDDETKREIEKAIEKKFTGTENASRIMLTFNDCSDNAPTIQKIEQENYEAMYLSLSESVTKAIYTALRVQPTLLGIYENTGFNSVEFQQSFKLFQRTVISPIQRRIGDFTGIVFKPFSINFDEEVEQESRFGYLSNY